MIPKNFHDWVNCITEGCKIDLTYEFAQQRLKVFQDLNNAETKKFKSLYGEEHYKNVLLWYSLIKP